MSARESEALYKNSFSKSNTYYFTYSLDWKRSAHTHM